MITFDIDRAVKEVKAGRVEFKVDKAGTVHVAVGKCSFEASALVDNLAALVDAVEPGQAKRGQGPTKGPTIASTMGSGIRVDVPGVLAARGRVNSMQSRPARAGHHMRWQAERRVT